MLILHFYSGTNSRNELGFIIGFEDKGLSMNNVAGAVLFCWLFSFLCKWNFKIYKVETFAIDTQKTHQIVFFLFFLAGVPLAYSTGETMKITFRIRFFMTSAGQNFGGIKPVSRTVSNLLLLLLFLPLSFVFIFVS